MQVSVETTSKIERRLTIVVPVEKLDEAFDKCLAKIAKTAKLKGFRPGKIPLAQVKQRFGDTARQEALSEVIKTSLYTALAQEKLSPVGVPTVEPRTIIDGQPLEFVATFEVLPEITAVDFKLDKLEKETTSINDQDVESVLNKIQKQHVKWNVVDRAAQQDDQVLMDFVGSLGGVPFAGGEAKDYPIVLGSKTMIPGFEDGLLGMKAGEDRVINVTFPENYFSKDLAGKQAQFSIKAKKVYAAELPALDETFVKRLGVKSGSLDDLKTEIKKNLDRESARLIKTKLKTKLFNKLLEQNTLEIPKALIEREAHRIHEQVHPHHGEEHHHSEEEMAGFNQAAEQNVALGLLMGALIKQHNITPSAQRVSERIKELASVYEKPEEIIKWYENDQKRRAELEMQVLEEQVVEKLLEGVVVTEKELSYEEFVNSAA